MELVFGIITGLVLLVLLVVVHELGHAIAARRNGVVVEEFGIGFPPRAWHKKLKNGVDFSLNWLPLGGFVKLQGEHDAADQKGDYGAATFWQKTKILLAGVFVNWVMAALLLTILAWTGLPRILPDQFVVASDVSYATEGAVYAASVAKGSPADKAGLKSGDEIRSVAGIAAKTSQDVTNLAEQYRGQPVTLTYVRDKKESTVSVRLALVESKTYKYLGVSLVQREVIRSTWSAPIVGVGTTIQLSAATLNGLGELLAKVTTGLAAQLSGDEGARRAGQTNIDQASQGVAGPIGILGTIFPAAQQAGLTQLVFLTAIISLTLAVMNILPIPALDGGRWFVTAMFRLLKKPLTKEREERIQAMGFSILMLLVVLATVADVRRFL